MSFKRKPGAKSVVYLGAKWKKASQEAIRAEIDRAASRVGALVLAREENIREQRRLRHTRHCVSSAICWQRRRIEKLRELLKEEV